jgi:hypothetical protein
MKVANPILDTKTLDFCKFLKIVIIITLSFSSGTIAFGQTEYTEQDIIGKYIFKVVDSRGGKYTLIFEKGGVYKEILDIKKYGIVRLYGSWKIESDSIAIVINLKIFEGKTDSLVQYSNFKYKIQDNALCKTFVSEAYKIGFRKIETCYKKVGRRSKKYPSISYEKIENPGYKGPWRNKNNE